LLGTGALLKLSKSPRSCPKTHVLPPGPPPDAGATLGRARRRPRPPDARRNGGLAPAEKSEAQRENILLRQALAHPRGSLLGRLAASRAARHPDRLPPSLLRTRRTLGVSKTAARQQERTQEETDRVRRRGRPAPRLGERGQPGLRSARAAEGTDESSPPGHADGGRLARRQRRAVQGGGDGVAAPRRRRPSQASRLQRRAGLLRGF
jgi:hypothetical protein